MLVAELRGRGRGKGAERAAVSVQGKPGVVSHPTFPRNLLLHSPPLSPPLCCLFFKGKFTGVPKTTVRFNNSLEGLQNPAKLSYIQLLFITVDAHRL